jgi:hypothetical protein
MALWCRRITDRTASGSGDGQPAAGPDQYADQVRDVLRRAGFREAGTDHAGFTVEPAAAVDGPAVVRFTDESDPDVRKMERLYHDALAAAGFHPVTGRARWPTTGCGR